MYLIHPHPMSNKLVDSSDTFGLHVVYDQYGESMMTPGIMRFLAMVIMGSGVLSLTACDAASPTGRNQASTPGQNPSPAAFDKKLTLRFIDELQWERAGMQYSSIERYKYDMTEFHTVIETKLLETIPTLPKENHDLILTGYEFLAKVQPDNPDYKDKVLQYTAIKQAFQKASIAKLRNHTDKVDGITWYTHPSQAKITTLISGIELYCLTSALMRQI